MTTVPAVHTTFAQPLTLGDASVIIPDTAGLYDAMERFEQFQAGLTMFAVDADLRVVGSLTRGDVIRCLVRRRPPASEALARLTVRDAMTPRGDAATADGMLWVSNDRKTWWSQLTQLRELAVKGLHRVRLIPVLSEEGRLVDVLDLEEPRARSRLETLVMAVSFPLGHEGEHITASALAMRRSQFDSIHYNTHWQKVEGLCELLLQEDGARSPFIDDIFCAARADEIFQGLARAEEWLEGHLSGPSTGPEKVKALREKIAKAKTTFITTYRRLAEGQSYYPNDDKSIYEAPEAIIVLGCKREAPLKARVSEAVNVVKAMRKGCPPPTLILSGGGFGERESEARRMLRMLREHPAVDASGIDEDPRASAWTVKVAGRQVHVALEEDSLDTLGNAVFSWCTLKLHSQIKLESRDPGRLDRLVVVTDRLHAPRSFDIFRRVFAFRPPEKGTPRLAVRLAGTLSSERTEEAASLDHLRTEAIANSQIFRLVNPLTNGYDIMEDGHIRSILAQMLRLHEQYKKRWDLARKYQQCWPS
jgi:CBS domain-containing protein